MLLLVVLLVLAVQICEPQRNINQYGPDPWDVHSESDNHSPTSNPNSDSRVEQAHFSDYFFKRLINVILNNRAFEVEPDGSREIFVAMKLSAEQWKLLDDVIKCDKPLTAEMYRRSVGYMCDSIYKPTLTEKVVQAWSEYVLTFYYFYKTEISLFFAMLAIGLSLFFVSKHVSLRRLVWISVFVALYIYEGFLSYQEYEKKDYEQFVAALKSCSWWFWTSNCDLPMQDKFALLKHMHPSKICMRMLSHLVTEPMVIVSSAVNDMAAEITGTLYYPFNNIVKGILILIFNLVTIVLIIMFMSTYILNIPFNISFLAGLINFGTGQSVPQDRRVSTSDRISGTNLNKLLQLLHDRTNAPVDGRSVRDVKVLKSAREGRPVERTPMVQYRSRSAGRLEGVGNGIAG